MAIYHTHSPLAVLASLGAGQSFSASHLQMVKAMRGHTWSDTLQVNIHTTNIYVLLPCILGSPSNPIVCFVNYFQLAPSNISWRPYLITIPQLPIIENRESEAAIADQLGAVVAAWPGTDAVLVRGHGLYVWGPCWRTAKVQRLP